MVQAPKPPLACSIGLDQLETRKDNG